MLYKNLRNKREEVSFLDRSIGLTDDQLELGYPLPMCCLSEIIYYLIESGVNFIVREGAILIAAYDAEFIQEIWWTIESQCNHYWLHIENNFDSVVIREWRVGYYLGEDPSVAELEIPF